MTVLRNRAKPEMAVQLRIVAVSLVVEFMLLLWYFAMPSILSFFTGPRQHWRSMLWDVSGVRLRVTLVSWVLAIVFGMIW